MKGDDISNRLLEFAVRIIKLVDALPNTLVGRHIGGQVLGSGTSLVQIMRRHAGQKAKPILCTNWESF